MAALGRRVTRAGLPVAMALTAACSSSSSSGGVVIFAVNSLLYLNQSVPPYGVSLNSLTNGTTVFPLSTAPPPFCLPLLLLTLSP